MDEFFFIDSYIAMKLQYLNNQPCSIEPLNHPVISAHLILICLDFHHEHVSHIHHVSPLHQLLVDPVHTPGGVDPCMIVELRLLVFAIR